jgi:hypothetical protein
MYTEFLKQLISQHYICAIYAEQRGFSDCILLNEFFWCKVCLLLVQLKPSILM